MSFDIQGIHGPDISFYQDANNTPRGVDFAKMKAAGATFVIIRAGQNVWPDPDFATNYAAAKAAGLPRGVYWFYDSRVSPVSQANLCKSLIANDLPELGVWLDLEEAYGGQYKGFVNWRICLDSLRSLPRVGIYTAPFYWIENRPTDTTNLNYFKTFPLWIAHYGVLYPTIPSPWTNAILWQYGTPSVGIAYGVESIELDMNHWNGDLASFHRYFGLTTELPQEPETEEPMLYKLTALVGLNMRSGPATTYPVTLAGGSGGGIRIGDNIESSTRQQTADGAWWYKIDRWLRGGVQQTSPVGSWACAGANGGYMRLDATVETPVGLPDTLWIGETRETVREYRKAA